MIVSVLTQPRSILVPTKPDANTGVTSGQEM